MFNNLKSDCFAFDTKCGKPYCTVLRVMECAKRKCPFYKSQHEYDYARAKYRPLELLYRRERGIYSKVYAVRKQCSHFSRKEGKTWKVK